MPARNIEVLVGNVKKTFKELPSSLRNKTFLAVRTVLECAIKDSGGNNFQISRHDYLLVMKMYSLNHLCDEDAHGTARNVLNN